MSLPRAIGLALGYAADCVLGDPQRHHPVAWFGAAAGRLEQWTYADSRPAGLLHAAVLVGSAASAGAVLDRRLRTRPATEALTTAALTWVVLGGRSLGREARAVHGHLEQGDLPSARARLRSLVGRDPSSLGSDEIARAVVESVAENTSDAVVAPLFWGAVAGPAGLMAYRAANTLDAMVGHRSSRLLRFGWASARLDDALNLVPARLCALLASGAAPAVEGSPRRAVVTWRRDAPAHPSPNAGPVEAAFAGALGIRLGGVNTYGEVTEDRGRLGDGRPVRREDIPRAVHLADVVGAAALGVCVVIAARRRG
jgi:adenosylcobinamide-phosphate synthase